MDYEQAQAPIQTHSFHSSSSHQHYHQPPKIQLDCAAHDLFCQFNWLRYYNVYIREILYAVCTMATIASQMVREKYKFKFKWTNGRDI